MRLCEGGRTDNNTSERFAIGRAIGRIAEPVQSTLCVPSSGHSQFNGSSVASVVLCIPQQQQTSPFIQRREIVVSVGCDRRFRKICLSQLAGFVRSAATGNWPGKWPNPLTNPPRKFIPWADFTSSPIGTKLQSLYNSAVIFQTFKRLSEAK